MEFDDRTETKVSTQKEPIRQNLRLKVIEVNRLASTKVELLTQDLDKSQPPISKKLNGNEGDKDDVIIIESDKQNEREEIIKASVGGVWAQNNITKNSIIHLVNPEYDHAQKTYSVDNQKGLLVLDPDTLLTCTFVASSLFCERKTWLNHVFLGQVGTNRAMLVGTLVHEVFQYGLKNRIADIPKLTKYLDELLDDATVFLEIYSVEMHIKDIRAEAIAYISSVKEWIEKYMFIGPNHPLTNDQNIEVKVIGVSDIEENVWSTKYGLKGKIDVTGAVRVYDKRTKKLEDKTIPLELKTGNPNLSSSHAAQVSLYSMMIEDRYAETNQGFVIYLKDKAAMHNVTLTHNIKRDLIQRRNQINYHMKSYYFGPDMIDQSRVCKNCERLSECVLMSNLYTPGKIDQFPTMKQLEPEATGHLSEKFVQFFKIYHEKLANVMAKTGSIDKDGDAGSKSGSFWTYTSEEAEAKGTGFGKLQGTCTKDKSGTSYVTFHRHPKYLETLASEEIEEIHIGSCESTDSDYASQQPAVKKQKIFDYFKPATKVDTSSQNQNSVKKRNSKPFNVNANFSRCRVAISIDSDDKDMDRQNSSTAIAIGFMSELTEDKFVMKLYEGALDSLKPDLMYRVDKIEKRLNIDIERIVLVRLLAREDWRCDRIRQLILDPKFEPVDNIETNLFVSTAGFEEIDQLDDCHQKVITDAVSTDNYYLINEKTDLQDGKLHKTISTITKVINNLSRSVLIVAKNIDNLVDLMRLLQTKKMRFILIDDGKSTKARFQYAGNLVKVPQIETLDLVKKFESYIRTHEMATVVITTYAMSIGGLQFTRKTFDYCICYECDDTELLLGLSPMFCSNRYILIDIRDLSNGKNSNGDRKNGVANVSLGDHLRALRTRLGNDGVTCQS